MGGAFEYRQAEEIRDVFAAHGVRYLFIGKSGAILLGFPDTTQDADLFVDKSPANCSALVTAIGALGFALTEAQAQEILRGKDFVPPENGLLTVMPGVEMRAAVFTRVGPLTAPGHTWLHNSHEQLPIAAIQGDPKHTDWGVPADASTGRRGASVARQAIRHIGAAPLRRTPLG